MYYQQIPVSQRLKHEHDDDSVTAAALRQSTVFSYQQVIRNGRIWPQDHFFQVNQLIYGLS